MKRHFADETHTYPVLQFQGQPQVKGQVEMAGHGSLVDWLKAGKVSKDEKIFGETLQQARFKDIMEGFAFQKA